MVHYYTPNGKPDKLRRPGRKWEPEAYAGLDKMTYCSATDVDLFAMNKSSKKGFGKKEGSIESVQEKLNEVTLQTYLQQIQEYEILLNPLMNIMKSSLGGGSIPLSSSSSSTTAAAAPRYRHPSEAGWGPIGEKLPEALEQIHAIPPEWKEQRKQYQEMEYKKLIELQRRKELEEKERILREKEKQRLLNQTDGLSEFNEFFDHDGEVEEEEEEEGDQSSAQAPGRVQGSALKSREKKQIQEIQGSKLQQKSTITTIPSSSSTKSMSQLSSKVVESPSSSPSKVKINTREEKERLEKRKKRVRERSRGAASIPWTLLDELDGEKKKFENEKNYLEFYHKF